MQRKHAENRGLAGSAPPFLRHRQSPWHPEKSLYARLLQSATTTAVFKLGRFYFDEYFTLQP